MRYRLLTIFMALWGMANFSPTLYAQNPTEPEGETPVVLYNAQPKKYVIAGIEVHGADTYDDNVVLAISGLGVGQMVTIPGDDITDAAKRYWRHGLFSDVSIQMDRATQDSVWLSIYLQLRPRASEVRIVGAKKSERDELQTRIGMIKGGQVTPNTIDRATTIIKRYYDEKGFKNAEVEVMQIDDPTQENQVIVQVNIDKKDKIKVNQITFEGNEAITSKKLKRVMKKTNEKNKLVNIFRTKKFTDENYEADKQLIIDKYNELGYRDAVIVEDSVTPFDESTVNVFVHVDEGQKYYLRNITWVGNTVYPTA